MPSWSLDDADAIAAANPFTFYKPSRELIARVKPGENVKLIFKVGDSTAERQAERMWVLVDEVLGDEKFRGRLNNDPYNIPDLKADDPIEFAACHIIVTEHDEPNLVDQYSARCLVTNRVLKDGERVSVLHRVEPGRKDDSGWRLLAGDESDAYLSDRQNSAYVSLGAVLSRDDSIVTLLDAPVGSTFKRDANTGLFDASSLPPPQ